MTPIQEAVKKYDRVTLLLQGGGALGSYQAGIYEGIHNAGIEINSIYGISIGALNTAIIAGNPREKRVEALRGFWKTITQHNYTSDSYNPFREMIGGLNSMGRSNFLSLYMPALFDNPYLKDQLRVMESRTEAFQSMMEGQKGFFKPRGFMPTDTTPNHLSYYLTGMLAETLAQFADIERINDPDHMHVAVSAVNVRTGNYAVFRNELEELTFDHFVASGSLPPAFPAVEIDGEFYWDGGLVSNTPLNDIIQNEKSSSELIFQVDLWDARGFLPETISGLDERIKDIQYSSKTRMITDLMGERLRYNSLIKELVALIPDKKGNLDCIKKAEKMSDVGVKNVIQLIYRKHDYERGYKDYEFSPSTMKNHWQSGLNDMKHTFRYVDWFNPPADGEIFKSHDIHDIRRSFSQC